MKMKTKWLLHPEDYRLGENESFYSGEAVKGWRLVKRGGYFSSFTRVNPERVLYRVELDSREPTPEQFALYEECGWEWVTKRGAVNVYRAPEGSDVPELYTDAEGLSGTVKRLRRSYILNIIIELALLAALAAVLARVGFDARSVLLLPETHVYYASIIVYCLATTLTGLVCTTRLLRGIRRGVMPSHTPKVRRPLGKICLITVWVLCLALIAVQLLLYRHTEMPEVSDGPYVTLSELGFEWERKGIMSDDPDAEVERVWSPVCRITSANETVREGGDRVSIDETVYDLAFPGAERLLLRALISDSHFDKDPERYTALEVPGWDEVLMSSWECWARRDGRLVRLYLYLPGSLAPGGDTWDMKAACFRAALELISER